MPNGLGKGDRGKKGDRADAGLPKINAEPMWSLLNLLHHDHVARGLPHNGHLERFFLGHILVPLFIALYNFHDLGITRLIEADHFALRGEQFERSRGRCHGALSYVAMGGLGPRSGSPFFAISRARPAFLMLRVRSMARRIDQGSIPRGCNGFRLGALRGLTLCIKEGGKKRYCDNCEFFHISPFQGLGSHDGVSSSQ